MNLLPPSTACKMLGIYTAPDSNSKEQAITLQQKPECWEKAVKLKSLYQYKILLAYHHGIIKSLEYPLGASLMTESQCKHAQSPALTTTLQKYGIIFTISRDIVHGPTKYKGLNFLNLYTVVGTQKVCILLGHIQKQDKTGKILTIALGYSQQEIGISTLILMNPYST